MDWSVIEEYWPLYLKGLETTLALCLTGAATALVVGIFVGMARVYRPPLLYPVVTLYVQFFRSTPFLVQLFFIYFGLPYVGVTIPATAVALIGLTLINGAYDGEIIKGCIQGVPPGQMEAGLALGLHWWQVMRYVVLPQALPNAIPALTGQLTYILKDSAVLAVISVRELTEVAKYVQFQTFRPLESFLPTVILYLGILIPLVYVADRLKRDRQRGVIT